MISEKCRLGFKRLVRFGIDDGSDLKDSLTWVDLSC